MSLKSIIALLTLSATILLGGVAQASWVAGNGTVTAISVPTNSAIATVSISNSAGDPPACHGTNPRGTYSIDTSTNQGKAMFALAQAAFLAGKKVGVGGWGSCAGGYEVLGLLTITP